MSFDINGIAGLSYVKEDGGFLTIGALTREADVDASKLVRDRYPLLADTAAVIGDPLVRNQATVAGNLAHADPANDHPATMLAFVASVVATGPNGARTVAISDFSPVSSPPPSSPTRSSPRSGFRCRRRECPYLKVERKLGDLAVAAVAL